MKKRKIIALVSIAILLIVAASILIVVYVFDETRDLRADPVKFEDQGYNYTYYVPFFDGANTKKLASVYINIGREYNDENRFRLQIWHEENTHLDKLTLTFPNMISDRLMYILPSGTWPPIVFGRTEDGSGAFVDTKFVGFVGTGTVNMEFRIQRYPEDTLEELNCLVDMQLSKDKGLKTIKYNAETYLEMAVPGEIQVES
jgi:hypothetical protein